MSQHSMCFPKALMEKAQRTPAKEMRITCIYLKASCLFQDKQNRSLLNDDILGASLGNVSVANLSKPVVIKFFHNHSLSNFSKTCVFWVEGTGEDNLGEWRTEGCETNASQESVVVCKCNHLTYFAVLLQLSSESLDENLLVPLTYLSDIGCGISASACFITIFLYLFTRKLYHDSTTKIHINLLGALFFLNVSFLISKTLVGHLWWCSIVAAFLHYSLLCSLTWMAIEGFHLYLLVIKVYNSYISRYLLKLSAVGWGKDLYTTRIGKHIIVKLPSEPLCLLFAFQNKKCSLCIWLKKYLCAASPLGETCHIVVGFNIFYHRFCGRGLVSVAGEGDFKIPMPSPLH
uniref:Adhesion G protein-coupled receptor G3 n=1 Tax=Laticauda laticaudata TaxID=8630 RepID=A0A8C5SM01_LATLA